MDSATFMPKTTLRILLVEDDEDDYILLRDVLEDIEDYHFELEWIDDYEQAIAAITTKTYHITFIDYLLGTHDGIAFISEAMSRNVTIPLILLTGRGDKKVDKEAMKKGAADFLVKSDLSPHTMERCIRYALQRFKMVSTITAGEQKFRQLFERSIDAVYLSDTNHILQDVNPSFTNLIGKPNTEDGKISLRDFFSKTADFRKFVDQLEQNGHIRDFETEIKTFDGSLLVCQLTSIMRSDHQEDRIGYQGIIRDMTEKKREEMNMIMAERLSMTGKIARSMAHEIRNPLTNLELALGQLRTEFDEAETDADFFLDIIDRNTKRIGQLITEMLESSKPRELNLEPIVVNELLDNAIALVKDRITLKGMNLIKKYDEGIKDIRLDAYSMKIVFVNLMVNAVEAMEEGSGILTIQSSQDKNSVYIHIIDNGKGIPEKDLKRLFDPFYTNKQGGMGLGLTSTQNIVTSHGGTIDVTSKVGEGTSFTLVLSKKNV